MLCERELIRLCEVENFVLICQVADLYNANRLKEYCAWFHRINPAVNELLMKQKELGSIGGGCPGDTETNSMAGDQQS